MGTKTNGYYLRLRGDNNIHFALNNWGIQHHMRNGGEMVMHLSSNSNLVDIFDDRYLSSSCNFSQDESVADYILMKYFMINIKFLLKSIVVILEPR